jgi:MinD-like ATPase involved in chromosome partitioning or flagellar assembly
VTVIAVVGDAATTTAVAIAVGWPAGDEVIVLEADPGGGSLAGWLDTPAHPSLATIVANAGTDATRDHRSVVETFGAMARRSDSGVRFVASTVRARAAHRAVEEAAAVVFPALASAPFTVIADAGPHRAGTAPSPALRVADVVVVAHRQASASTGAATVRIERLVETVEELAHLDAVFVLAVIGRAPFDPEEIGAFVDQSVPDTVRTTVAIAEDPLAAATIAGRAGVSAKRLRRLPLMRSACTVAVELSELVAIPLRLGTDDRHGTEAASA